MNKEDEMQEAKKERAIRKFHLIKEAISEIMHKYRAEVIALAAEKLRAEGFQVNESELIKQNE